MSLASSSGISNLQISKTSEAIFCLMKILKCAPEDPWWTKSWTKTHEDKLTRAIEQVRWAIGSLRICFDLAKMFAAPEIARNAIRLLDKRDLLPITLAQCLKAEVSQSQAKPVIGNARLYFKQTKTCTAALLDHVNRQPVEIPYEVGSPDFDSKGQDVLYDEPHDINPSSTLGLASDSHLSSNANSRSSPDSDSSSNNQSSAPSNPSPTPIDLDSSPKGKGLKKYKGYLDRLSSRSSSCQETCDSRRGSASGSYRVDNISDIQRMA